MKNFGFGFATVSVLLLIVLTPGTTMAQGPVEPHGVSVWTGEYFNNIALSGSPAFARDDTNVDFFWRENTAPVPGVVNINNYSIRWTRAINFPTGGKWTFHFVADDGVRIWVDDNIVIDAWYDQAPTPHIGTSNLSAGWHNVRIEYYNRTLGGTAKLSYWGDVDYANWKGEYFANQTLTGTPMFIRNDLNIDFNWGIGSPEARIPADHFSVRWTRKLQLDAIRWRFTTTTDDGVRLWVDDTLLIDKWMDQAPTTHSAELDLTVGGNLLQGEHFIKMEYYENAGGAVAKLVIAPVTPTGEVWHGQYFNNISLIGAPIFVRDDPAINFQWGYGSPGAPLLPDNFSVRWDTRRQFARGDYFFAITSDDGARVWVDGNLVINAWFDHAPTTFTARPFLESGLHDIRVEYYERGGNASVVLQIATEVPPPVGEVVVDDRGAGWSMGGPTAYWHNAFTGIGGQSLWTFNNSNNIPSYNWARWAPPLRHAGNYEVFAYIPSGIGNTLNARYWIFHGQKYDVVTRSQALFADQWMSLGTYYFDALGGENVLLSDITYECYTCRKLVFDAVKFSPR